ncbi:MAG TPA: hypothetical protein VHO24_15110 [Opitutaceae bacterium]|nr:hypothetical protein [Opitutaceae bacterium]
MRKFALSVLVAAGLVFLASTVIVYTDVGEVCEYTASHRESRFRPFGGQSRQVYHRSALETFLEREHPGQVAHRWTSYKGNGKNIFGRTNVHGHGSPGVVMQLPAELIDALNAEQMRRLYVTLRSGNEAAQETLVRELQQDYLNRLKSGLVK